MLDIITKRLVNAFVEKKLITNYQKEEYEYALICELESLITIGSVVFLSLLLDNFLQTICFLSFFLSLRKRSGGYHLNSFVGCYIGTIIIYLAMCVITSLIHSKIHLYIFSAIAFVIIAVIGAINHPNMDFSSNEYRGAKKSTRLMLCFEIGIIVFMVIIKVNFSIIAYALMGININALFLIVAKLFRQEVKYDGKETRGFNVI